MKRNKKNFGEPAQSKTKERADYVTLCQKICPYSTKFSPLTPFTLPSVFLATFCQTVYCWDTSSFVKIPQITTTIVLGQIGRLILQKTVK